MNKLLLPLMFFILFSCKNKSEKIRPVLASISESVYASGIIKSKNQYQAYVKVNGIIENVFVSEGDTVKNGSTILTISNETQKLNKQNAELSANFSDFYTNQGKLKEAKLFIRLSKYKMLNDSSLFMRQKNLWRQQVGTKAELEQKELAYQDSRSYYYSSILKYDDLKRQINFSSSQSKKNLLISSRQERDFTLRSEIDGKVYNLYKKKGEIVDLQTPVAIIGDAKHFLLQMQVDEYDIIKIKIGLTVLLTMDSYKGKVFEAKVSKIYPFMNERSKTFLIEATFSKQPLLLYPNTTFEANIILRTKYNAILVPRGYILNDSIVIKSNGDKVIIKTGLKDYQNIEIVSGVGAHDELIKPVQ